MFLKLATHWPTIITFSPRRRSTTNVYLKLIIRIRKQVPINERLKTVEYFELYEGLSMSGAGPTLVARGPAAVAAADGA